MRDKILYWRRRKGESKSDYQDRIIDTNLSIAIFNVSLAIVFVVADIIVKIMKG